MIICTAFWGGKYKTADVYLLRDIACYYSPLSHFVCITPESIPEIDCRWPDDADELLPATRAWRKLAMFSDVFSAGTRIHYFDLDCYGFSEYSFVDQKKPFSMPRRLRECDVPYSAYCMQFTTNPLTRELYQKPRNKYQMYSDEQIINERLSHIITPLTPVPCSHHAV